MAPVAISVSEMVIVILAVIKVLGIAVVVFVVLRIAHGPAAQVRMQDRQRPRKWMDHFSSGGTIGMPAFYARILHIYIHTYSTYI
jgi:hypothetical protein